MSSRILILIAALLVIVPFYIFFERKKPSARTIVLITVLAGLAVAGRAAFFMTPFFKPVLAFVIIAGVSLGPNAGFIVGSMSALVSNFIFGQGPWTIFQMVAWGVVGLAAGLLSGSLLAKGRTVPMMIYGFLSAFLIHGLITDIWTIFFASEQPTLYSALAIYAASIVPDAVLGAATALFLLVLGHPMVKKIERVKLKYGLSQDGEGAVESSDKL
ncbi:MAG: ECF transporter S component [Anaerovoracaceae bacterium]|jgi:energy-coupling factor transport system substrate-specific component